MWVETEKFVISKNSFIYLYLHSYHSWYSKYSRVKYKRISTIEQYGPNHSIGILVTLASYYCDEVINVKLSVITGKFWQIDPNRWAISIMIFKM